MTLYFRLAIFGMLSLVFLIQSSTAQSDRRYVLGETISFETKEHSPPQKSDFVGSSANQLKETRPSTPPERLSLTRASQRIAIRSDSTSGNVLVPAGLGVAGGLVGGGLGVLAGGHAIGALYSGNNLYEGIFYSLIGATAGEILGVSAGVYLGTGGSYPAILGGSLGGALCGILVAFIMVEETGSPKAFALAPVVQLGITIPTALLTR